MARIRSIKPEFWTDEKIIDLSAYARLLFIGMWNFADDQGFTEEKHRQIKFRVLPCDDVNIAELIDELVTAGLLERWRDADTGTNLLHITGWDRHQVIKNPSKERFANPTPILPQSSGSPPPALGEDGGRAGVRKGREGKGEEKNPPTPHAAEEAGDVTERHVTSRNVTRPADPLWDALTTELDIDTTTLTKSGRGAINRALAELRAVNATPDQIHHRAAQHRHRWPQITLTAPSLAKHWATLEPHHPEHPTPPTTPEQVDAAIAALPVDPTGFLTRNRNGTHPPTD